MPEPEDYARLGEIATQLQAIVDELQAMGGGPQMEESTEEEAPAEAPSDTGGSGSKADRISMIKARLKGGY